MRNAFWTSLMLALSFTAVDAQQPGPDRKDAAAPRTVTLTGCVEQGSTPNQFTLQDPKNGRYEVSGSDIKKYVGRRVQVAGTPGSTRFRVKGGLWPTPNIAAQAGSIDPAQAAVAAQPGGPYSGTGDINLPTFKVKAVRTLDSACG
jgi:hypothetical protein